MPTRRRTGHAVDQGSLIPEALQIDLDLRRILVEDIEASPLSRHQIADRLSELLGRHITKPMLDNWTAETKQGHRVPADALPALCSVLHSLRALERMADVLGAMVLSRRERLFVQLIKIERQRRHLDERATSLRARMAGEEA